MKITELKEKSEKDLSEMLTKTKKEIEKVVSEVFQGKSKDTSKIKKVRKEFARIQTVLSGKRVKENA